MESGGKLVPQPSSRVTRVRQDGRASLHLAAYQGHVDLIQLLLTHGANVTATTAVRVALFELPTNSSRGAYRFSQEEWTALHAASDKGHVEVVKLLLAAGAVPAAKGKVRL